MTSDAYVELDEPNATFLPGRRAPIILVPGIMGSRLADPATDKLIWNPKGSDPTEAGSIQPLVNSDLDFRSVRLHNVIQPLEPAGGHDFLKGHHHTPTRLAKQAERAGILHSFEVVWPSYRDLLLGLDSPGIRQVFREIDWGLDLSCCGYDWRRSCDEAAQRLARRVAEARERCGGEKAIIIAHSLGGRVTRRYLWAHGGRQHVGLLFLCASPSLGAPKVWSFLKQGVVLDPREKDFDKEMAAAGLLLVKFRVRDFMRKCLSMWELLPKRMYTRPRRNWLEFEKAETGLAPTSDFQITGNPPQTGKVLPHAGHPDDVYADPVTGFADTIRDRAFLLQRLAHRAAFDNKMFLFDKGTKTEPMKLLCLDRTVLYCSKSHLTFGEFEVKLEDWGWNFVGNEFETKLTKKRAVPGDNSVPLASASPRKSHIAPKPATRDYPRRFPPVASEHGAICTDIEVMTDIAFMCLKHLGDA